MGEATAAEARKAGFKIAFVPQAYVAESLVEGLLQSLQNRQSRERILLARAAVARDVIPEALRLAGAAVAEHRFGGGEAGAGVEPTADANRLDKLEAFRARSMNTVWQTSLARGSSPFTALKAVE